MHNCPEAGIPADIQELLLRGNPDRGIAPGALKKAISAALAAERAAMPTVWEDPAGKGYPCFERPMTAAEAKDALAAADRREEALRSVLLAIENAGPDADVREMARRAREDNA